ncbi:MAG: sigma-70 family RNA polymerase sigma factor [Planctomycetota bacterium]
MTDVRFRTTRWTLVSGATSVDDGERSRALEELCAAYWPPLYAYLRRRGRAPDEASDLVQGLFHVLLERDGLARIEARTGRFRSWLLTALRNHERDVRDHAHAQRRGSGVPAVPIDAVPIDAAAGERAYQVAASSDADPVVVFERAWVRGVLDQARSALLEESIAKGNGDLFRCLEPTLDAAPDREERAALAERLGLSPVALRVAIHRMRERYRALILAVVRETLSTNEDPASELDALLSAVSEESHGSR